MSNTELTKFYMGLPEHGSKKIAEVPYTDIISALDNHFNGQWAWELVDERFAQDNTTVCTTVMVYTPGRVYTGRSLCKIKDYASNHLFAILDACQTFIEKGIIQQPKPQSNLGSQQMTPDQIMNAINQQAALQPVINNSAQFYNHKDEQGMPSNGVPFESLTDNCLRELEQELVSPPQQQTPTPQGNVDYDAPQERLKGFSQHQIDRLNQFKKDFDILNDEMFGNYVNTWDKSLTSKKDINPKNVESFLEWTENLGKMGC